MPPTTNRVTPTPPSSTPSQTSGLNTSEVAQSPIASPIRVTIRSVWVSSRATGNRVSPAPRTAAAAPRLW